MRNTIRGTTRLPRAAALLALALAACGTEKAKEDAGASARRDGGEPRRGGTAVLTELADLEKPLPLVVQTDLDNDLVDAMYLGLTAGRWENGRMVYLSSSETPNALAWMWEFTGPDSTGIRFRMRSAARWSDGAPITAHDVVWTYRMIKEPAVASPRQQDVATVDSVVAENDSTVVFHFPRRHPGMMFATGVSIAPRHAFEGVPPGGIRTHEVLSRPERLPASGPFRIASWQPGRQVTLEPNPHFPRRPYLDRIVVRVIPDPATRLVELQTGRVHMVKAISFDRVKELRQRAPNLRFETIGKRFWEYVAYNPRTVPAFRDPAVRRALGQAVDVPGIVRALDMGDFTTPAAGPYPPIFRDLYDPQRMKPLAYDPDSARAALEAAGWRDTDGDGIREKDGRPLRFTLLTNSGNQRRADVSQLLQRQWREVGADARLAQRELGTFAQAQADRSYEALLGSWGVGLSPDIAGSWLPGAAFNIVGYDDPETSRLIEEARAQPTAALATPLWKAAAERIVAAQPYTFLYYYDIVVGVDRRLKGTRIDTYGALQNTWEWWMDDEGTRTDDTTGTGR